MFKGSELELPLQVQTVITAN